MARLPLTSGAYSADSIIASAQRCVNLYPEINPKEITAPVPITLYQRPGRRRLSDPPTAGPGRCAYRSTNRLLFAVVSTTVYYIDSSYNWNALGDIKTINGPVKMMDNGSFIFIVDGSTNGYYIDMSNNQLTLLVDNNFYGSNYVDYVDTFFVFNRPQTSLANSFQWYISPSEWAPSQPFTFQDLASKSSYADPLTAVISLKRQLLLVGEMTSEIWYNSGAQDFTFTELPGTFVEHGSGAIYSLEKSDINAFWLSNDKDGKCQFLQLAPQDTVKAVSTRAIEKEWQKYSSISDAISTTFQINGHVFIQITFPTADKTWTLDRSTEQWFETIYIDDNGKEHRDRIAFAANVYGIVVGIDWQTGRLYQMDPDYYADDFVDEVNGDIIKFVRGYPNIVGSELNVRITHDQFVADIQCGTQIPAGGEPQMCSLRYSDTRGASWRQYSRQSLGAGGEFETSPSWNRLGLARDRVYEISWSGKFKTAMQGAWLTTTPHES